jgi:hypothetical protein
LNSSFFWDITPCRLLNVNGRFGGSCRLLFEIGVIINSRDQFESRCQAEPSFLLDIFFDPEDGG